MANEHAGPVDAGTDYAEHLNTYHAFLRLLAYGAGAVVAILILLALIAG